MNLRIVKVSLVEFFLQFPTHSACVLKNEALCVIHPDKSELYYMPKPIWILFLIFSNIKKQVCILLDNIFNLSGLFCGLCSMFMNTYILPLKKSIKLKVKNQGHRIF